MKVGLCSVYSWRPHVEQMYFLAQLLEKGGVETDYMVCRGDLPTCYTRELRPQRSKAVECALCQVGNFESYPGVSAFTLGPNQLDGNRKASPGQTSAPDARHLDWGASSAGTIIRFETNEELDNEPFLSMREEFTATAEIAYESAKAWIKTKRLDAVLVFNGRMDATRGVSEAAAECGIPYLSVERPWFGHGIQILPNESCLGLQASGKIIEAWVDRPLTERQAYLGAKVIAERFLRRNNRESRAYNVGAKNAQWPRKNARWKVLLLPGSRNEVFGHSDWQEDWVERTDGYDALIARYKLNAEDIVLRAHPAWSERIGSQTGQRSEAFYREWCAKRNVEFIPGDSNIDTLSLIRQSDLVVIHASSAALDAGMLGKRVVCLSGTNYKHAGFVEIATNQQEVQSLRPLERHVTQTEKQRIISQAVRFCYAHTNRIPQFVDYVRCESPTTYSYFSGASPNVILDIIRTGKLSADDMVEAQDAVGETRIVDLVEREDWETIISGATYREPGPKLKIQRRGLYRFVDEVRALLPNGDR